MPAQLLKAPRKTRTLPPLSAGKPEINPTLLKAARLLDEAFTIPGTSIRVGLDGVIGLIPGVGDLVTVAFGYLMLQEARRLGLPKHKRAAMLGNYLLDMVGGFVPVVGDLWDFAFKANRRNLRILQKHLEKVQR